MKNIQGYFNRGFHKIIQSYFVMKSNSFLSKTAKCKNSKPKDLTAKCLEKNSHATSPEALKAAFWKKVTFFGAFPILAIVTGLVFLSIKNEPEKVRPEFVKYEYLRVRNKRFPWGDGNKTLFHNPRVNALPDGYED